MWLWARSIRTKSSSMTLRPRRKSWLIFGRSWQMARKPRSIRKSILAEARVWAMKRNLFGAQAFLRYVILRFAENLCQVSDDFVFKGGNLLWIYINTPRATTDLDLATLKTVSHALIKESLERACELDQEIRYSI